MQDTQLKGKWALVTGASSGLGSEFARELASLGCNLILTARREDRLAALQAEISERYGVSVTRIPLDLSVPSAPQQLYVQIASADISVDVLVNNAGFGIYGKFIDRDWQREQEMLQLNVLAVAHLTRLFVPGMIDRKFGYLLNVASNGAYQPVPLYAAYGASKSFVLNFSEALRYELRGTGVHCTALSPGTTITEFHQVANQDENSLYVRFTKMDSKAIASLGIKAMLNGRASYVPGWRTALLAWVCQRAPRSWVTAITGWLMRL